MRPNGRVSAALRKWRAAEKALEQDLATEREPLARARVARARADYQLLISDEMSPESDNRSRSA